MRREPLTGFDVPPADGWQYCEDVLIGAQLREGTNPLRVVCDEDSDDRFVVNNVTVHRREPADR